MRAGFQKTMTPEELAREKIDVMLAASGWAVQNYKDFNASAARGIALREVPLTSGRCDYLLLVDRKALGVTEAKKGGTKPSAVADQSAYYGDHLPDFIQAIAPGPLPFLYESTGIETFFRDGRDPSPRSRRVFTFHRPETLAAWAAQMLDTFNEVLIQAFSLAHPATIAAYKTAIQPGTHHPDLGAWLRNPALAKALPKGIAWFKDVHDTRVKADLAHAKSKKGVATKPVRFAKREKLRREATVPWAELIIEWKKII